METRGKVVPKNTTSIFQACLGDIKFNEPSYHFDGEKSKEHFACKYFKDEHNFVKFQSGQ